jgi:hypothetical protein
MDKVTREVAEADVQSWLDYKKIFTQTREKYKDHIDVLVDAVMNGALVLDKEKYSFIHTLLFPFEVKDGEGTTELKFRARANGNLLNEKMRGVKSDDADARLEAMIAALCDVPRGMIGKLDTADKRITVAIGIFFM